MDDMKQLASLHPGVGSSNLVYKGDLKKRQQKAAIALSITGNGYLGICGIADSYLNSSTSGILLRVRI